MGNIPLEKRILLIVTDKAVVYQSELMEQFAKSEDFRNHGEVYDALYSLVRKNKITLHKKDGVDLIYKEGVEWH